MTKTVVGRAQKDLEKPGSGSRGQGMKSGFLPSGKGRESGGEGGAACAVSFLEATRGLSHNFRCWNRQPPGPPWEAQSLLGSTPSTLPLPERSLHFEGCAVAWSFSFPLFSPNSLLCPEPHASLTPLKAPRLLALPSSRDPPAPNSQVGTHRAHVGWFGTPPPHR